jgi:hypothetical protein
MRVLYLIFSHDNLPQLARLVDRIRSLSPDCLIAVHHDPNGPALAPGLFKPDTRVHLVPEPVRGEWGDFSLVEQYLQAMRWCDGNLEFDWLITITGLSYPIQPLHKFEAMLAQSEFDAYVYHFDAFDTGHWPPGTARTRYQFRYFKLPRFVYDHRVPAPISNLLAGLRSWLNRSQHLLSLVPMPRGAPTRLGIRRLRLPLGRGFRLYGGRQMLNINRRTLQRVRRFLDCHPEWIRYQQSVLIPDESFFNSIIANDPGIRLCNATLRYIQWPKAHASSVGVIGVDDLDKVFDSEAPFGLKFDLRVCPEALQAVDAHLGLDNLDMPRGDVHASS